MYLVSQFATAAAAAAAKIREGGATSPAAHRRDLWHDGIRRIGLKTQTDPRAVVLAHLWATACMENHSEWSTTWREALLERIVPCASLSLAVLCVDDFDTVLDAPMLYAECVLPELSLAEKTAVGELINKPAASVDCDIVYRLIHTLCEQMQMRHCNLPLDLAERRPAFLFDFLDLAREIELRISSDHAIPDVARLANTLYRLLGAALEVPQAFLQEHQGGAAAAAAAVPYNDIVHHVLTAIFFEDKHESRYVIRDMQLRSSAEDAMVTEPGPSHSFILSNSLFVDRLHAFRREAPPAQQQQFQALYALVMARFCRRAA